MDLKEAGKFIVAAEDANREFASNGNWRWKILTGTRRALAAR